MLIQIIQRRPNIYKNNYLHIIRRQLNTKIVTQANRYTTLLSDLTIREGKTRRRRMVSSDEGKPQDIEGDDKSDESPDGRSEEADGNPSLIPPP